MKLSIQCLENGHLDYCTCHQQALWHYPGGGENSSKRWVMSCCNGGGGENRNQGRHKNTEPVMCATKRRERGDSGGRGMENSAQPL